MSLWTCFQCWKDIPVQKARSHCQRCGEGSYHYICGNCLFAATLDERWKVKPTGVSEDPPSFACPWDVFFDNSNIAAVYWELVDAIYDCLNRSSKTWMLPEDWSKLSDITGDPKSDGICRSGPPRFNQTRQLRSGSWARIYNGQIQNNNVREADFALRQWLEVFDYTRVLGKRYEFGARNKTSWEFPDDIEIELVPDKPFTGATPLIDSLTLAQIFHVRILTDPDRAHSWINAILRHYKPRIWRERGDVPRWCLPETADPDSVSYLSTCQWKLETVWGKQAAAAAAGIEEASPVRRSRRLQGRPPEVQ